MESITHFGFCEDAALSKYARGLPLLDSLRMGNPPEFFQREKKFSFKSKIKIKKGHGLSVAKALGYTRTFSLMLSRNPTPQRQMCSCSKTEKLPRGSNSSFRHDLQVHSRIEIFSACDLETKEVLPLIHSGLLHKAFGQIVRMYFRVKKFIVEEIELVISVEFTALSEI